MLVVDASLVVDYLLDDGERGAWSAARIARAGLLHAPHLLDFEVASAARKLVARRLVSPKRGHTALRDLTDLAVQRYPAVRLLDRMWELRATLTPYDASYVALAEALALPLATTDSKLARARGHRAHVESFAA
ncbi:MAG: type II toxin-antitoxin system VapC family toxin [Gaiellaceae bacterium]